MISWRYHVVSIVAVVLSFGLGILAGTSVVNERFVENLQANTNRAQGQRDAALAELAIYGRFATAVQPALRDDRLLGEEAVVVTVEGVDRQAPTTVEELTAAGADVLATLELGRTLVDPPTQEDAATLAAIAGLSDPDPETVPTGVAQALAGRLAEGTVGGQEDLLEALLSEGFVNADRDLDTDGLLGIGGAGQVVVIAAGGRPPPGLPPPDPLLVPLTERLVQLGVATAAVAPREDPYGFVDALRASPAIPDCSLVTVDDIDLEGVGGIALVMGIARLLSDDDPAFRPGGDYGIEGGSMIVPGADEPPDSCRR